MVPLQDIWRMWYDVCDPDELDLALVGSYRGRSSTFVSLYHLFLSDMTSVAVIMVSLESNISRCIILVGSEYVHSHLKNRGTTFPFNLVVTFLATVDMISYAHTSQYNSYCSSTSSCSSQSSHLNLYVVLSHNTFPQSMELKYSKSSTLRNNFLFTLALIFSLPIMANLV